MRPYLVTALFLALFAAPGIAQELPESCQPSATVTGTSPAQLDEARLRCDLDRAAIISARSARQFIVDPSPLVRVVDTESPSGAAYIYDVVRENGRLLLDARNVPMDDDTSGHTLNCRLRIPLPDAAANQVVMAQQSASAASVPAYGLREEIVTNPDGSRRRVLLFDTHDIITHIETANGPRDFSRHARATDKISQLNAALIGVANVSDQWTCLAP